MEKVAAITQRFKSYYKEAVWVFAAEERSEIIVISYQSSRVVNGLQTACFAEV